MQVWKLVPLVALLASACATTPTDAPADTAQAPEASEPVKAMPSRVAYNPDPYPSTYQPLPSDDVLIRNATVFDGLGGEILGGAVLIQGGKITAVGSEAAMTMPAGIRTIDGTGKFVTPGIIDIHSHLGA